jgi:hypothetical protein
LNYQNPRRPTRNGSWLLPTAEKLSNVVQMNLRLGPPSARMVTGPIDLGRAHLTAEPFAHFALLGAAPHFRLAPQSDAEPED